MTHLIIIKLIFFGSAAGIGFILLKKMPVLANLPEEKPGSYPMTTKALAFVKGKYRVIPFLRNFSLDKFLWKSLLKLRILILKSENQVTDLLEGLKNKSKAKNNDFEDKSDKYWEELKKAKRGE